MPAINNLADLKNDPDFQGASPEVKQQAFARVAAIDPDFPNASPEMQRVVRSHMIGSAALRPDLASQLYEPKPIASQSEGWFPEQGRAIGATVDQITSQEPPAALSGPTGSRLYRAGQAALAGIKSLLTAPIGPQITEAAGDITDPTGRRPLEGLKGLAGDVASAMSIPAAGFSPVTAPIGGAVEQGTQGVGVSPEAAKTVGDVAEMLSAIPLAKVAPGLFGMGAKAPTQQEIDAAAGGGYGAGKPIVRAQPFPESAAAGASAESTRPMAAVEPAARGGGAGVGGGVQPQRVAALPEDLGAPVTAPWRAGQNVAEIQFGSQMQRDLFGIGGTLKRAMRGAGEQGAGFSTKIGTLDDRVAQIAQATGRPAGEIKSLAGQVYDDVRGQMSGVKDGETRPVVDNVGVAAKEANDYGFPNIQGVPTEADFARGAQRVEQATQSIGDIPPRRPNVVPFPSGSGEGPPPPKYAGSINLERIQTEADVRRQILNMSKQVEPREVVSLDSIAKAADDMGFDLPAAEKLAQQSVSSRAQFLAARQLHLSLQENLASARELYRSSPTPESFEQLRTAETVALRAYRAASTIASESGLQLRSYGMEIAGGCA